MSVKFHLHGNRLSWTELSSGFQSRHPSLIQLTHDAFRDMELPRTLDLEWTVESGDAPYPSRASNTKRYFSMSGTRNECRTVYPDFVFDKWPEIGLEDYDGMCKRVQRASLDAPLSDKIFWIGARSDTRLKMYDATRTKPELFDVRFIDWSSPTLKADKVEYYDHPRWRYLLDVEGAGYSGRTKLLAFSNRLLFLQDRPWWDMTGDKFVDGVNCVFVKRDFSDLVDKAAHWMRRPYEASELSTNLLATACKQFTRANAHQRIRDLVLDEDVVLSLRKKTPRTQVFVLVLSVILILAFVIYLIYLY